MAFEEATKILGHHDAVEEFLTCGIWPLSGDWDFVVEKTESPLSKVTIPMLKVTDIIALQEMGPPFKASIASAAKQLVGNYN
jgi:hypothetical protein